MFIIAIDGASGTGKGTICKLIASKYDLNYLDTGAIYRCVALIVEERDINLNDDTQLKNICDTLHLRFKFIDGESHVFLEDRDITEVIRTPQISMAASKISAVPVVRASLLDIQRRLAGETTKRGTIVDGRDMGTVVFPDADLKIFLTASDEVRARRRYDELKGKGMDVKFSKVLEETIERDRQDSERSIAPLKKADDAIEVNTDGLDIDEVKGKVVELISPHLLPNKL